MAEVMNREIRIEWGGKTYGPYRDANHARSDGFRLPAEDELLVGLAPVRKVLEDNRQDPASFLVLSKTAHQ
jgi:hypothetical protein